MTTSTVTRLVGTCQICEATRKLTSAMIAGSDPGAAHRIVHHGYERPGDGAIHGDCEGVGEAPFEVSCEATRRYLARVKLALLGARARLAALQAGDVTELRDPPNWRGEAGARYTPASPTWALELRAAAAAAEQRVDALGREVARLEAMIARWVLVPLRTLEEHEAPARDARVAAKAQREAGYLAKTETKIASYRKRLAAARKNHTQSTIADIFESAPRQLADRGLTRAQAYEAIESADLFAAFGLDPTAGCEFQSANWTILGNMRSGRYDPTTGRFAPLPWPLDDFR